MKFFNKNDGFTLIEIIVSLAILAITVTAFTPVLLNSAANVFSSGDQSDAMFEAQMQVVEEIVDPESITSRDLDFIFAEDEGGESLFLVPGNEIVSSAPYTDIIGNKQNVSITYFIPDSSGDFLNDFEDGDGEDGDDDNENEDDDEDDDA